MKPERGGFSANFVPATGATPDLIPASGEIRIAAATVHTFTGYAIRRT
jgi:hypothetical protein